MTTWRLLDGVDGRPGVGSTGTQPPSSPTTGYTGAYTAGAVFYVTEGGKWLEGYYQWVPPGGDTGAQKFALWSLWTNPGTVVTGSTITSGTLTAGQWNYVALDTPLALSPGIPYIAATGWTVAEGFPDTKNQFGSSDPYADGITNGPLVMPGGSAGGSIGFCPQNPYDTTSSDPGSTQPSNNDANDILWVDVSISDVAPKGTTYRAWPNMQPVGIQTTNDQTGYTLGLEFSLSQKCNLEKIWHYSTASDGVHDAATVLPSRCAIWDVTAETVVSGTDNQSPTWLKPDGTSASAGDGWVYCDYSSDSIVLSASTNYKISTYGAAGSDWFAATPNWYGGTYSGVGYQQTADIVHGPLTILSNGNATPGQQSWNTETWAYPATSTNPESDWIDVEVSPVASSSGGGNLLLFVAPR